MTELTIRPMTESDRAETIGMMRVFYASDAVSTNGSEEIFSNDVDACVGDSPYAEGYIFCDGENILGYAMLAKSFSTEFGCPCIWVEDIYIKPQYRGRSFGKRFFAFLFEKYPNEAIRLEVEKENVSAVGLYKKCGFRELPYDEMISCRKGRIVC